MEINKAYLKPTTEEMKTGLVKLLNRKIDGIDLEVTQNKVHAVFFMENGDIYRMQVKENKYARLFIEGSLTDLILATIQKIKAIDGGYAFVTDKGTVKFEYEIDMLETIDEILEFETLYLKAKDTYLTDKR